MMNIAITAYEPKYNQEVIDLILTIQQTEFAIPIDINAQPDLKTIKQFYQKGNGNFWVATVNNQMAGTIALLDIGYEQVALRKMFVKQEYRGKEFGIGQALLNTAFQWAADSKLERIFLGTTKQFVAAQRFYEKNGFMEIDKCLLPKTFPVMEVDVKFYAYQVNQKNLFLTE